MNAWHFSRIATDNIVRFLLPLINSVLVLAWHGPHDGAPVVGHIPFVISPGMQARILRVAARLTLLEGSGLPLFVVSSLFISFSFFPFVHISALFIIIPIICVVVAILLILSIRLIFAICLIPFRLFIALFGVALSGWEVSLCLIISKIIVSMLVLIPLHILVSLFILISGTIVGDEVLYPGTGVIVTICDRILFLAAGLFGQIIGLRVDITDSLRNQLIGPFASRGVGEWWGLIISELISIGIHARKGAQVVYALVEATGLTG